uniref:Large ribosomal subunit protein uL6 n=1 Tax=uncultured Microgenomates bacterium Rifle_16ft_4_minimus_5036 TaxID=1665119 RepID=A0A0H4TCY0_9BACT|nr:50S ribosomal protein L6, large subunit ribosomal protein L6 [uncultured Microgenomates bacterium Rifle_16ft_4_minimus_5036]
MSKIGRQPVLLPDSVSFTKEGSVLTVKGPKGELSIKLPRELEVEQKNSEIVVTPKKLSIKTNSLHGTYRSILFNMVCGVTQGWSKTLELVGTGYRAEVSGKTLSLTVGYSHPIKIEAPDGISFKVEKSDITVEGVDKVLVGEVSAKIRAVRPPEPYKGKGIRYKDEIVRRKAGKAAKTGA